MLWLGQNKIKKIKVNLPTKSQQIYVGTDLRDFAIEEIVKRDYSKSVIFVDEKVAFLEKNYLKKLKKELNVKEIIKVVPSEKTKSVEFLNFALEKCINHKLNRKSCILAFGGGIVGDAAGFLASVYMRGIDMIFLPTTLMSQGDTVINKVALSYRYLKNVFGAFFSPILTICDVDSLPTLPKKEISLGLSEIIKHALIDSDPFTKRLEITKPLF